MRRRYWLLGLLGLALVVGLWLAEGAGSAAGPVAPVDRAPARAAAGPPATAQGASAAPAGSAGAAGASLSADAQRWRTRDAAWCAQARPLLAMARAKGPGALESNPTAQALAKDMETLWPELLRVWELRLRARPDPESQALAEMLWLHQRWGQDVAAGLERLRRLSELSQRPWVLGLAAQLSCERSDPHCATLARRWTELEPHNLAALRQPLPTKDWDAGRVRSYMQGLLRASYLADPREEMLRRLWQLESLEAPGLRRAAIPSALMGVWAAFPLDFPSALIHHCKQMVAAGENTELCLAVAERHWQLASRHLMDEALILALARQLMPLPDPWPARAQDHEARQQWVHDSLLPRTEQWMMDELACAPHSGLRDWTSVLVHDGEITALEAQMPRDAPARRALAERYRKRMQRGVLDPRP